MNKYSIFLFTILMFVASSIACGASDIEPSDDSTNLLRDPTLLSRDSIDMPAERFLNAWLSKNDERERMKANMYLLGVMDATENKEWCSYKIALPHSLRESLFDYIAKLPTERKKERASKIITEALAKDLPCKKNNKK
ncbi:Rap1a/Tai family immunity protein [Brenneria sp. g21c3]|uniref:Rap1a/Tai family immunity protein n=1 Tax=Brenneria sp. g21c3 TaxID=3093893 RepID=UPI002EC86CD1|nr:Rap1a/Tai family immunity protein [Brenneria sp. g21c3]